MAHFNPYTVEWDAKNQFKSHLSARLLWPLQLHGVHGKKGWRPEKFTMVRLDSPFKLGAIARQLNPESGRCNDVIEYHQYICGQIVARVPALLIRPMWYTADKFQGYVPMLGMHVNGKMFWRPAADMEIHAWHNLREAVA